MSGRVLALGPQHRLAGAKDSKKIKSWSIIITLRLSEASGNAYPFAKAGLWEVFKSKWYPEVGGRGVEEVGF